jgi:hypothetical protein
MVVGIGASARPASAGCSALGVVCQPDWHALPLAHVCPQRVPTMPLNVDGQTHAAFAHGISSH